MSRKNRFTTFLALLIFSATLLNAQENLSPDELLVKAKKEAYEDKNYPAAIATIKTAIAKSPDYADLKIFLGRLYTFSDKVDSARVVFQDVLVKNRGYADAHLAYGNLEFWNGNSVKALGIVEEGVKSNPTSQDLLLLKSKILKDLGRFPEASASADALLKLNPKLTEARALGESIKDAASKNTISLGYEYSTFDKQFADPWHLANISYGRQTSVGSIIGRLNYANRFASNGLQYELDIYPRISKTFYAYMSAGYSGDVGVFPKYRSGFSLYANLPSAFEAELGYRTLSFDKTTWIYTAAVGKYVSNYWINLRAYLTPSNNSVSQSVSLNVRYYFGGSNDYFSLGAGTGISPDNQSNVALYNNGVSYKLKSNHATVGYNKSITASNIISIGASFEDQEYLPHTRGNQFTLNAGYSKRF